MLLRFFRPTTLPVWVRKRIDQLNIGAISLKENHHIATLLLREVVKDFFLAMILAIFLLICKSYFFQMFSTTVNFVHFTFF